MRRKTDWAGRPSLQLQKSWQNPMGGEDKYEYRLRPDINVANLDHKRLTHFRRQTAVQSSPDSPQRQTVKL